LQTTKDHLNQQLDLSLIFSHVIQITTSD
jgi:hypothetical protein